MKTIPQFKAVLELERAEFILARRNLQNRPNDPRAQQVQQARMVRGRTLPNGNGEAILDSAALEREANRISDAYILAHKEEIVPEPVPEPTPEPARTTPITSPPAPISWKVFGACRPRTVNRWRRSSTWSA